MTPAPDQPPPAGGPGAEDRLPALLRHAAVLGPALLYAASALYVLATNYWTTEQGGYGPIILISGAWLLWNRSEGIVTVPPTRWRTLIGWGGLLGFGLLSVVASMTVKQFIQVAATYLALVSVLFLYIGGAQVRRLWAPLLYLAFLIPPPENWVVALTHGLKSRIAGTSVSLLADLGYPVAQSGATLFIGSYELVVAAACSGLNSLISLLAIGIFYSYLRHPRDLTYAGVLALLVIPIAVFANFCRVIVILLLTYHFGDAVGQSMIHDALGIIVFVTALGTLFLVDIALHPLLSRLFRRRPHEKAPLHAQV